MTIVELTQLINAQCPIHGINSDGGIHFKDEATPEQRVIAENLMTQHLAELE